MAAVSPPERRASRVAGAVLAVEALGDGVLGVGVVGGGLAHWKGSLRDRKGNFDPTSVRDRQRERDATATPMADITKACVKPDSAGRPDRAM
jgi:hypothetical protein